MATCKPKPNESEKDFVARFMADQAMEAKYADEAKRREAAKAAYSEAKAVEQLATVEGIFESLMLRQLADRWGIGTALQYVKSIDLVFSAGLTNPTLAFDLAPAMWAKELESAARRLTYCDEGSGDVDFITKSLREGTDITRGAVLEYDCILSTKRKDRDGDILEPGGMDVDQKMPLLWQHVQSQPIGKHISVLSQDENRVVCKFAIADIPLGRDAATLVKFGALRKSHGFKPMPGEFEPVEIVKTADGKQVAKGWHIRKSSVLEGSLVSIPSNADSNVLAVYEKSFDGLCTAFSRDLLKVDAVKHWAKSLYEKRPIVSRGVDMSGVATADMATKGIGEAMDSFEFPGSFEWVREKLQKSINDGERRGPSRTLRMIAGTFADSAIVCEYNFDGPSGNKCYRQSYETKDGVPTFTGEPKEITVTPTIMEKLMSAAELQTKEAKAMTPVTTISGVDSTGKEGKASDGELAHDPAKKRCPNCGKADLDSTNSCRACGYIDNQSNNQSAKEGKSTDAAAKSADTLYAKEYGNGETFSADKAARQLLAAAVTGDETALKAIRDLQGADSLAGSLATAATPPAAERDVLEELFAE